MSESEPQLEPDMFSDDLKRYMLDVMALEADGMADLDNNRIRLTQSFDSLLERLSVEDMTALEKINTMLPVSVGRDLALPELVLQYKIAPLKLIDPQFPDPVLPLESLTPRRIEAVFNHVLAGEEVRHPDCITGDERGKLECERTEVCPMRYGRFVGKELLELFAIQRHLQQDDIEPQLDPALYNLLQIERSLVSHQLMLPGEIGVHANLAIKYIDEQLRFILPPDLPRTNDETNDK